MDGRLSRQGGASKAWIGKKGNHCRPSISLNRDKKGWNMAQRGRKSAASLMVALAAPVTATQRLAPPAHISEAERAVWVEVVNDQPAEAFSLTHAPLLELYCRHITNARVIADELMNFNRAWIADDEGLKRYDRLLAMNEREGRAASSLATRLRITRQAVENPATVGRSLAKPKDRKPWELPISEA